MKWLMFLALIGVLQAEPGERVKEIRGWYQTLQDAKPTRERAIKFEAQDEPFAGTMTVREFAGGFAAVTASYGSEHGGADEHLYFKDGELFFVYDVENAWHFIDAFEENGIDSKTAETRREKRFYFEGGKCIRQLARSLTEEDAGTLAAKLAKIESEEVEPGDEAAEFLIRGSLLLKATKPEDVLKAFGITG